ncbi:hypothetical protein [Apilactobacillus xinyiensis]|uniref:hypothetical protein n=1 Tax=Apilactobacillus xinyiensis TaxID=2841032 RepID=UPI00201053DB|nr:hypothetical protein [Apilactobacillus xinyiensis]MCL0329825.1 hypothetical protein [Apilactobacillus xinyiensis]
MITMFLSISLLFNVSNIVTIHGDTIVKKFPKELNGTWYTYYDKGLKHKLVINAKKMEFHPYVNHVLYTNNPYKSPKTKSQKKYFNKTKNWTYAYSFNQKHYRWYTFYMWQYFAGNRVSYNVHKFNGHKVLSIADESSVDAHYYKSKSLAKKMGHKKYHGFDYTI